MTDYEMDPEDKEVLAASMAVIAEAGEDIENMIDEVVAMGSEGADADCHITGEVAVAMYNIISILTDAAVEAGVIDEAEIETMMDQFVNDGPTLH